MVALPKDFISRLTGTAGIEASVKSTRVGILAFETARAMSRLVTLLRALTPTSISVLQNTTTQSTGVAYLNSSADDKVRLLQIACAEMLDELDQAAAVISRLSARCASAWPRGFSQVYSVLKSGGGEFYRQLVVPPKVLDGKVRKMESFVASASNLYSEMEVLSEMEASERKLERWINHSGPIIAGGGNKEKPPGADIFLKKIGLQRKLVKKLQDQTLWCRNKEKVSELMAGAAVAIFLRICVVFGNQVPELPAVKKDRNGKFNLFRKSTVTLSLPYHMSGPLLPSRTATAALRCSEITKFSGPLSLTLLSSIAPAKMDLTKWTSETLSPHRNSVGSAGLALRYADVIVLMEKIFRSPKYYSEDHREELYQMLPESLRNVLREKLKSGSGGVGIAAIEEAKRVLDWLGPMAHDTIKWCSERSYEKRRIDSSPKVLMLQTLHNSDRKKTEVAIVDVLLGLCSLFRI